MSENNEFNNHNNSLGITIGIILGVLAVLATGSFGIYYSRQQKAPLSRTYKIENTDTHIETSFNNKYGIIRVDLTIDEVVEDWQINTIGKDTTDITLECETKDLTVKKEYEFKDVPLVKGEKLKGSLILEGSSAKDYTMLKDLVNGNLEIKINENLSLNTQKRDEFQQEFYNKKEQEAQEKAVKEEQKKASASASSNDTANNAFFNNLFNF